MLELGSSKPWPEALELLTGQPNIDAAPLVEYFQPILDWLQEQNSGYDVTWDEECPPGSVMSKAATMDHFYVSALFLGLGFVNSAWCWFIL